MLALGGDGWTEANMGETRDIVRRAAVAGYVIGQGRRETAEPLGSPGD
jgi:hypothetical protein